MFFLVVCRPYQSCPIQRLLTPSTRRRGWGLSVLGSIPNVLPLKAKGNRRAIRVQVLQPCFQDLGKVGEIAMLVQLEQPTNLGDERGLD